MRIRITIDGRKNSETSEGFPIVIYVKPKNKKEKLIRTGYFAKKENWDRKNALPKKHPQQVELLNYLEQKKITIQKILAEHNIKPLSLHQIEAELFQHDSDIFYEEAQKYITSRATKNALNSFQRFYPDLTFSQIDSSLVKKYMNKLIVTPVTYSTGTTRKRSVNGVASYLNSLTALWNKTEKPDNPFSGIRPDEVPSKDKSLTDEDLIKIRDADIKRHSNSKGGGLSEYLDYFMLCFYLGGCDLGDLSLFRYDQHVYNGRIEFIRHKSGTNVHVSNYIFPEAWELLNKFDCKPYLIPLRKNLDYDNYTANLSRYYEQWKEQLGLSRKPYSKSPRYTFITRAQNLLIDERIAKVLVGHSEKNTHSLYKGIFPYHIRDKAHKRIIDLGIVS